MRRFSKLITHVLSNPAKAARPGLAPRPAPSLANAQHDFSFGCAILKGCDRGGGLVERVDDGLGGIQPARGEQWFDPCPLFGQGAGVR
jgi:hypothetical protein